MSVIKPFKGYRPTKNLADKIAAPPYDVVSTEEAKAIAANNPYCLLHISRSEIELDPKTDPYAEEVYKKAAENYQKFIKEGYLKPDAQENLYIYRLVMEGRAQTGIVAGVSAEEYEKGLIKRHELTRAEKEEDRRKHTLAIGANTGLVFLTYPARKEITDFVAKITSEQKPEYHFTTSDQIIHTFWVVKNSRHVQKLVEEFKKVPALYIADGHHRASVGNIIAKQKKQENPQHTGEEPYNYFMAGIFPHNELKIMDYNRVLKDLNGLSAQDLIKKIQEKFNVTPSDNTKPQQRHMFKMFLDGKWYKLEAKEGTYDGKDPVKSLDVSILQENVLAPILAIQDPRRDKRIDFVGGIRGMAELEKRCQTDCKVAFALYPVSIEEIIKIADAGLLVPPKSTWFEPKLRSGLVLKPF